MLRLVFLLFVTSTATAGERVRLYDTSDGYPRYKGYAETQPDGSLRVYDKKSRYQGKIDSDRVYSRDGRVQEKLYLWPNSNR